MAKMPIMNKDLCKGCGLCVSVCYCKALILVDDVVMIVETEECGYCTDCEAVCPNGAICCPYEIVFEEHYR